MEMNESLQKQDQTLDAAVKKIEKQAKDLGNDELKIETSEGKSDVKVYIQKFKWDDMKYPRSRALNDIATQIGDKMKAIDADIKK